MKDGFSRTLIKIMTFPLNLGDDFSWSVFDSILKILKLYVVTFSH